ncbi:hypothetical protein [Pseudomonas sp. CGJS7]|uniref:hypothetical protein n=1 Tax=Pseudomonas sp. CGJS7 TaxID=3109348 RepID=UPI00300AF96E
MTMRAIHLAGPLLWLALAVTAGCGGDAPTASSLAPVPEPKPAADFVVVVGERLSLESVRDDKSLDLRYKARYRVEQLIHGRHADPTIEFELYRHTDEPELSGFPHALLFLRRDGDRWLEALHYPVFRARQGGWAGCAPRTQYDAKRRAGRADARPDVFAEQASFTETRIWARSAEPVVSDDFRLHGDQVTCLTGTPVQALYEANKDALQSPEPSPAPSGGEVEAPVVPVVPVAPPAA